MSHLAHGTSIKFVDLQPDFSSFDFVEDQFAGSSPIRKLFSISRCREGKTLIVESMPVEGSVAEENEDLLSVYPDFEHLDLVRLSFWEQELGINDSLPEQGCLGYAILKHDRVPSEAKDAWHVYEAVFLPYPHQHNYANATAEFEFLCGEQTVSVRGCLYAQQNGLNKTCAQVAIRSITSTFRGTNDLSYREINQCALDFNKDFDPSQGMSNDEIAEVLKRLGLNCRHFDYELMAANNPHVRVRRMFPYQKYLYSGIESGGGALLAFSLSGPGAPDRVGHVIPFFGHTFNEDAWAPIAHPAYFRVGETIQYIPSREWMSSFIVHDDNFGVNLCIPKNHLERRNVSCVFEILPEGWEYSGAEAEVIAAKYFYSILPYLPDPDDLPWLERLLKYVLSQRLILRHVPISKEQYLEHLRDARDWKDRSESSQTIEAFETTDSSDKFWMIEVSVPEVFPTNKRKLGEILLDATQELSPVTDGTNFVLARFPGYYAFLDEPDAAGDSTFVLSRSDIRSHVPLFSTLDHTTQ